MTVSVALIAAVAVLTGAVIAAVTAGRRQKRELAHNRELADVTELRAVLDDAARKIVSAEHAIHEAYESHAKGLPLSDSIEDELLKTHDAMSDSAQRIRIRLGVSDTHTTYDRALNAHRKFREVAFGSASVGKDGDELPNSYIEFCKAGNAFFEAVHQVIGSRIGHGARKAYRLKLCESLLVFYNYLKARLAQIRSDRHYP